MTTDSKFEIAQDIFVENSIFKIERNSSPITIHLAAALKIQSGMPLASLHGQVLSDIFLSIKKNLRGYSIWLVMSNGGVVPDGRIARHFGLWRGLAKASIRLPIGEKTEEYIVETHDGIQFFAGLRLSDANGPELAALLLEKRSIYVLATAKDFAVHKMLRDGWGDDSRRFPSEILSALDPMQALLISPLGEFDDREGGAVAIGNLATIREAFSDRSAES